MFSLCYGHKFYEFLNSIVLLKPFSCWLIFHNVTTRLTLVYWHWFGSLQVDLRYNLPSSWHRYLQLAWNVAATNFGSFYRYVACLVVLQCLELGKLFLILPWHISLIGTFVLLVPIAILALVRYQVFFSFIKLHHMSVCMCIKFTPAV